MAPHITPAVWVPPVHLTMAPLFPTYRGPCTPSSYPVLPEPGVQVGGARSGGTAAATKRRPLGTGARRCRSGEGPPRVPALSSYEHEAWSWTESGLCV